jgi:hypothetical protein
MNLSTLRDNDQSVRRALWLLSSIAKKVPKKHLEGSENDYLADQIRDTLNSLKNTITENWEETTKEFRPKEKLPSYGDHMTIERWLQCVECGGFIDYDGHGNLATETQLSDIVVYPSDVTALKLKMPSWATHVMWFNR